MPFIPVPNTALIELIWIVNGEVCVNTLYFERAAPWTGPELAEMAGYMHTSYFSCLKAVLSSDVSLSEVRATSLESAESAQHFYEPSSLNNGESAGDAPPNNVACQLLFHTNKRGRSNRGKNYLAGIPEASWLGNALSADIAGTIDACITASLGTVDIAGVTHVVVSRYSGVDALGKPIPREVGITEPVTSYDVSQMAVSQKRRLPGNSG